MSEEAYRPALALRNIKRSYGEGHAQLLVFDGANLDLNRGEMVALVGPSGAGKSSLLHIAGLLEAPDSGEVFIDGLEVAHSSDKVRTEVRRAEIGFVYQFHHLLPEFDALENVMMPQLILGQGKTAAKARASELLDRLGLGGRMDHRPTELSGGEQQRVAIARAVANKPKVLLADEPTGNLDPRTADGVYEEFLRMIADEGLTALIATHNMELAAQMHRVVRMENGQLVSQ
ncbi:MAG: ABC transporter ATP-binding protein [Pseudomonadota bacterium]